MKRIHIAAILLGMSCLFLVLSCKKKSKPEAVNFEYSYPDVNFQVCDSADFGSTTSGWTYVVVEKMANTEFFNALRDHKVNSADVSNIELLACTVKMSSSDSSYDMFDSVQVKLGGTFNTNGQVFVSGSADKLIAQLVPVPKTGSKQITLVSMNENCADQMISDAQVAYRIKFHTMAPDGYYFPKISMSGSLTFRVSGMTH